MEDRGRLLAGPLFSTLLGLLSLVLLLRLLTGVPAIILGFLCLRRANALDRDTPSTRWAKRLAISGMVLGLAGSILGILGLGALGLLQFGETSRRTACADQMRRIGQAVALHYDTHKEYPPATVDGLNGLASFAPWLDEPYPKRLGWMVTILPFLDRPSAKQEPGPFEKVSRQFNPLLAWDAPENRAGFRTPMRGFICPSQAVSDEQLQMRITSYVGITGVGEDAVELPPESPDAGLFGYMRRVRHIPMGAGYVAILTETGIANGPWAAGDRSTLRGFDPTRKPYVGYERPFGGLHPKGANLLTVDGAVTLYTPQTNPSVLENLAVLEER